MTEMTNMDRYNNERQALAEKRKQRVLEVAEKVILDKGLGMTSMNDIMKAAKVSKATLYRYYESMDVIAFEIEYKMIDRIMPGAFSKPESQTTFMQYMYGVCLKLIEEFHSNEEAYCFIGMFDNYYSRAYPSESLSNDYEHFLDQYSHFDDNEVDEMSKIRAVTHMNLVLSFLQRLASRGKLLEETQGVSVDAQLHELKMIIERESRYE